MATSVAVWHFAKQIGRAACGCDAPNIRITDRLDNVTCADCLSSIAVPDPSGKEETQQATMRPDLRTIIAHPFFALAREFQWDDRQLMAARQLIDITVIRIEEWAAAVPAVPASQVIDYTNALPHDFQPHPNGGTPCTRCHVHPEMAEAKWNDGKCAETIPASLSQTERKDETISRASVRSAESGPTGSPRTPQPKGAE